jgi:hypothetical protein
MTPTAFDGLGLAEPLQLALSENYLKPRRSGERYSIAQ